jgi:hypothetical protein
VKLVSLFTRSGLSGAGVCDRIISVNAARPLNAR